MTNATTTTRRPRAAALRAKPTTKRGAGTETTRTQFLNAAEQLFAVHGYEGTTIRAIAERAGANLGALQYYWGSKETLFREVCERRLRPINEERMRRFDACVAAAGTATPDVRELLLASYGPALGVTGASPQERATFRQFYGRALTDPSPEVSKIMTEIFDKTSIRYLRLMRQALAHLDDQEFFWRMASALGTLLYVQSNHGRLAYLSRGLFDPNRVEEGIDTLTHSLAAGMMAPPLRARKSAKTRRP